MNRILVFLIVVAVSSSSEALAGSNTFTDDDFASACADVMDNSDRFEHWEEKVQGAAAKLTATASSLSKADSVLIGDDEFRMGARLMPVRVAVDISGVNPPSDLQKGDRFLVVGTIVSGAFWANAFEGCYLNVKASEVTKDGF